MELAMTPKTISQLVICAVSAYLLLVGCGPAGSYLFPPPTVTSASPSVSSLSRIQIAAAAMGEIQHMITVFPPAAPESQAVDCGLGAILLKFADAAKWKASAHVPTAAALVDATGPNAGIMLDEEGLPLRYANPAPGAPDSILIWSVGDNGVDERGAGDDHSIIVRAK
jgi:hypothetical protein